MLRAGLPTYGDDDYTLFTSLHGGTLNGTIPMFMRNVADTMGFGIVEYDYTQDSKDKRLSSYTGCLASISLNLVDFCIGEDSSFILIAVLSAGFNSIRKNLISI